ncbi:MAG: arginine--tRNA ligase [Clostridiales bacterium]|nr:arginine--tRNA ligase [Clostridiales bacterium]
MQEAAKQIEEIILSAYTKAVECGALPSASFKSVTVETPKDQANGDFSSTFAMQAAKMLKMPPRKIAEELIKHMDKTVLDGSFFSLPEVAGAGFINFRLNGSWDEKVIRTIFSEGNNYGYTKTDKPERIMVEFVSANPTGPMHMGNARGGVLGDCIAEVLKRAGNEVTREFLVNDAGNQVSLFARSLEARYIQYIKGEDACEFPDEGYHGDDIKELAAAFYEKVSDTYLQKTEEERRSALTEFGLKNNINRMKEDLGRYRISYDRWFFETELHDSGYVKETMELLKKRGVTYEKDGALWLRSTDFGCEKDDVLIRDNGIYTYFAADIAYHRNKFEERKFDRVINVWGADHHGHVKRLKGALDALGLNGTERLEIVLMQLVRLMRDGEIVRMSKRTGKAISLTDLLDEIPVDAARFFFNSRASDTHLEFDLSLAVREDSDNPVYYVQYAHARIMSILRNLESDGIHVPEVKSADLSKLSSLEERLLIKAIAALPEEIRLAAQYREPSRLNRYASEVATAFHRFYTACRIKDAEGDEVRNSRILLCLATAKVIENTLSIIGVTAPERM